MERRHRGIAKSHHATMRALRDGARASTHVVRSHHAYIERVARAHQARSARASSA